MIKKFLFLTVFIGCAGNHAISSGLNYPTSAANNTAAYENNLSASNYDYKEEKRLLDKVDNKRTYNPHANDSDNYRGYYHGYYGPYHGYGPYYDGHYGGYSGSYYGGW